MEKVNSNQAPISLSKKKITHIFRAAIKTKCDQGSTVFPFEKLFGENKLLSTYSTPRGTLVLRLTWKFFKEKEFLAYKAKKDPNKIPIDFSSSKGCPMPKLSKDVKKYYDHRYYLFSRYDEGIILDEESWYSVTPEEIAQYLARKCKCNKILDAFCGAGGNAIQFATVIPEVIANDIDDEKIRLTENNAEVYGVSDNITLMNQDFMELPAELKPDIIFMSPPWGGVHYSEEAEYSFSSLKPDFIESLKKAFSMSQNVVLFLPRNIGVTPLIEALSQFESLFSGPSDQKECFVTVEALVLGIHNIKALVVYLGPRFHPSTKELLPRIEYFFTNSFESFDSILVQNVIKFFGFGRCFDLARETINNPIDTKAYMLKLQGLFTEEQWALVKSLHKKRKSAENYHALEALLSNPTKK